MPLKTISTGRGLMGGGTYADKVLATGPIAYWPLWEKNGTVARCLVNPAQNGVYSSDVSTWPTGAGIGDGNTAPQFDGTNDYVNVFSATLVGNFNGNAGTHLIWIRVANAGVWTDATRRDMFYTEAGPNNWLVQGRGIVNNLTRNYYTAGGVLKFVNPGGLTDTDWVTTAITWDSVADEVRVYWDGTQVGATQNLLGVWAGALILTIIGATNVVPVNPWHGWLAHCQLYGRALTPGEIAGLAVL